MTNTVARSIEQTIFAVKEVTKGTAVFPTVAAEAIVTAGSAKINQQPTFTDSDEMADTLDLLERFQDQVGAGSFSLPFYNRPSGAAGTAPMGNAVLESLMGVETTVGATSVAYTQAKVKPSFTLWLKKSHTVFFGTGACAESASIKMSNKGASMFDISGGFLKMGWAGTDEVVGVVTASTSVVVTDAKKFTAGGYVQFDADTNTNAGYKIDSVNYDTGTLTMVDSITCADEAVIKGFLPTLVAVGAPLENKYLTIAFDGSTKVLKSLDLTINSPVAWQTDEITSSGYVEEYVEDRRSITMSISALFRESDLGYFYDATQNTKVNVVAVLSNGAGKICTLNLPYTELEVPEIQDSTPTVSLSMSGTALGSSGEDSCSIVFT